MEPRLHQRTGAYAVIVAEDHILLVKSGRGPFTGTWVLPGGGIEHGESPEQTLHRELLEETGLTDLTIPAVATVRSSRTTWTRPDGHTEDLHQIRIVYRFDLPARLPVNDTADGEDSLGAAWIPLDDLDDLDTTGAIRDILRATQP